MLNSTYIEYSMHMVLLSFFDVYIDLGYSTIVCYLFSVFAASCPRGLLWLKDIEPMMLRLSTHICDLNELIKSLSPFNWRSRAGTGYQTIKLSCYRVYCFCRDTCNAVSLSNGNREKYFHITLTTYDLKKDKTRFPLSFIKQRCNGAGTWGFPPSTIT